MIFGFNTDIKYEDVVYHVQSEARHADLLLQTQVFVHGRCIGKTLVELLAADARAAGVTHLRATIQSSNKAARALVHRALNVVDVRYESGEATLVAGLAGA